MKPKVPSNAPVCCACGQKYGEPVRTEFPMRLGICSICGDSVDVCKAKEFGHLPNLPQQQLDRIIRIALHCGFPETDDRAYRLKSI